MYRVPYHLDCLIIYKTLSLLIGIKMHTCNMASYFICFPSKQASKQIVFKLFNFEYNLKTTENNLIGK
jgi:hypothetical protein